jgi:hypothetical protein
MDKETYPKTDAGFREIDLDPLLLKMLRDFIEDRKEGFLFQTESATMLNSQSASERLPSPGLLRTMKRSASFKSNSRSR